MRAQPSATRRKFLTDLVKPPKATGLMTMREGVHGEKVSILGFGMMRLPTVDGSHANNWAKGASSKPIDQDQVNAQVDYALSHGINYFDTSPAYCRGESERVTGIALSRHPRSSYYLATKLSNFNKDFWKAEKAKEMFEKSLKSLRTDYIDFYLLHSIGNGSLDTFKSRYINNGILDWLVEQRAAGRIKNLGFSYHGDPRAFEWCMENHGKYKWDFCQIQLNYVDWLHAKEINARNMNAKYLYETLAAKSIPAIVMEPLLGGRLAKFNYSLAEKLVPLAPGASLASWALRFAANPPKVLTVLSGMTYMEHIEENVAVCSPFKPLTKHELDVLEEAAQAYLADKTIPCNSCDYCMPCPYGLDIPAVLNVWNAAIAEKRLPDDPESPDYAANRRRFLVEYSRVVPRLREAERCIGCGRCTPHCPQRIEIAAEMRRVGDFVERLRNQ